MPLNAVVRVVVEEWTTAREKLAVPGEQALFVSRAGTRLSTADRQAAVERLEAEL